jgi:hypothetical protein
MADQPEGTKTIVFGKPELDPEEAKKYSDMIAQAKGTKKLVPGLKGSTPVGHVERPQIPLLQRNAGGSASPISDEGGVQPRPPGSPPIRPETVQQLQDMQKAQAKQPDAAAAEEGLKKDIEKEKEDLFEMFDFNGKTEADRILNNKQRRKEIEARCEPMKLEDLVMKNEVQQDVPIMPGKFVVRYRSATPIENLLVKRLLANETVESDQYMLEKYGIMQLCLSLVSINGVLLPSHLDEKGEPKEELFERKLKVLMNKSAYVIADLGINFFWFDIRVRKLLNPDDLKNG